MDCWMTTTNWHEPLYCHWHIWDRRWGGHVDRFGRLGPQKILQGIIWIEGSSSWVDLKSNILLSKAWDTTNTCHHLCLFSHVFTIVSTFAHPKSSILILFCRKMPRTWILPKYVHFSQSSHDIPMIFPWYSSQDAIKLLDSDKSLDLFRGRASSLLQTSKDRGECTWKTKLKLIETHVSCCFMLFPTCLCSTPMSINLVGGFNHEFYVP
jgi:hypothetical protein